MGNNPETNLSNRAKEAVRHKRTLADEIVSVVPGFGKHSEKDMLRNSDQLARDVVYKELRGVCESLCEVFSLAVDTPGSATEAACIEKAGMKTDAMVEKIRHASRGYSPISGAIKVDTLVSLSGRVDFDASFENAVLELKKEVQDLKAAVIKKEGAMEKALQVNVLLDSMDAEFNTRDEALRMG